VKEKLENGIKNLEIMARARYWSISSQELDQYEQIVVESCASHLFKGKMSREWSRYTVPNAL